MAEAENILGIHGQIDISDIQSTVDKLCSTLQLVGVETDALSERMTKALNDIAKSDGDISTKTQQAMGILKEAMDEVKKGMEDVPSMIKIAQQHVDDYQSSISKLNAELANTPQSSSTYGEITKQLEAQQAALKLAQEDVNDLTQAYSNASDVMGKANSVYEALNAASLASSVTGQAQAATNVAVGASATAAATATGAEAAAHVINASAATANTEAEKANAEATKGLTSSLQEYISVASGRAEIERMQSESSKELRNDIRMYEQAIKDIQSTLDNVDFSKKISDATASIERQQARIKTYKEALDNLSSQDDPDGLGAHRYNTLIEQARQKIADLQSQIEGWQQQQQTLNADLEQYNTLLDAAKQIQGGETIIPTEPQEQKFSVDVDSSSLQDLRTQLNDNKSKLQDLEAEADKFNGKPLGDTQKQKLNDLNKEIDDTKEKISVLQDAIKQKNEETFIGKLRNQLSELKEKVSEFGSELKGKIVAPFTELGDKINNSGFGKRFSAEFSQVKAGMEDFKNGAVSVITANGKLQENVGNLTKAIGGLGLPLGGALTGIKAVTKALWGMCATPIGAIIAAIVLGLKAVHTWMTKSAEGQKVYTKLMAFFGSLLSTVTDMVVTFGGFLYHCFADANGPLNAFGKNLVKTFTSAGKAVFGIIGGIGTALKGMFTLDWDTFTSGLKKTWGGIVNAGNTVISAVKTTITGVAGIFGTVKDFFTGGTFDKMSSQLTMGLSTARKMSDLAGKQQDAEIAISKAKEKQAELDIKIAENREKIYQLTGKEKLALIEETKALERQKYDGIIDAQKKMLSYQQQRMKLHTNSLQDIAKERELNISLLRTEAQRAASTRMLTRQEEATRRSLERQDKSAAKAAEKEAKKNEKQNEQTKAAQSKYSDTLYNNDQAREKAVTDLETKIADARIAAMDEGFTKIQAERKREQEKELQDLQTAEKNAIDAERKRQKAEFDARNAIRKAQGKSTLVWNDDTDFQETDDIKSIRQMYSTLQQLTVNRQVEDEKKLEEQLIQAHQSFTDRKLAIDKKYKEDLAEIDAAIAEAQKRGDQDQVDALERSKEQTKRQYSTDTSKLTYESISSGIDWKALFSGIDNLSTEMLKPMLEQLKAFTKTDKYQNADSQTQKDVAELIKELQQYVGSDSETTREEDVNALIKAMAEFTEAIGKYNDAQQNEKNAYDDLESAKRMLDKGEVTQEQYDVIKKAATQATAATEKARNEVTKFGNNVNNASDKLKSWSSHLTTNLDKAGAWKNVDGLSNVEKVSEDIDNAVNSMREAAASMKGEGEKKLANTLAGGVEKGLNTVGDGLGKVISSGIGQIVSFISQIAKLILNFVSSIKSVITGILDSLSDFVSLRWIDDLVVSILNAIGKLIDTILDLPENIYHVIEAIVVKGIGGLLNTIIGRIFNILTFGALSSKGPADWFTNSNAKEVADTIDKLTNANKTLEKSINDLKDTIKDTKGVSAISASEQAIKLQKEANDNYRQIAEAQASYHNHHHSWNYYWNGFSDAEISGLNSQFAANGLDSNWTGNLFDLSPEQMKILRSNADIWQRILDTGKGEYGDRLGEKLDDYINQAGKLEEITDQLNETLTTTTKENVFDDFLNSLDKLASGSQDVFDEIADNWQEMVNKMVVNNIVGARFKGSLDKWLDDLADLDKKYANKEISDSEYKQGIDALKSQYTGYVGDAQQQIEQLRDMGIIQNTGEYSQNATSKGVSSITYDQANLLVNLATARNISLEQGNAVRQLIQVDTTQLRISTLQIQSDISVMRDIQEQGLTQITRIEANTRPISEILSTVQEMYRLQRENA